jgi:hypothetical protein
VIALEDDGVGAVVIALEDDGVSSHDSNVLGIKTSFQSVVAELTDG